MHDITVAEDRFGYGFGKLLEDIGPGIERAVEDGVKEGCKVGKRETKAAAEGFGWEEYPSGFSYKVIKGGIDSRGEVGNKTKPGLVHLLEKGHAKVGGGRTRAFPHVAPGYDAAAPAFEKKVLEGVDRALG